MSDRTSNKSCVLGTTKILMADGDEVDIQNLATVWNGITGIWNSDIKKIKPVRTAFGCGEAYPVWLIAARESIPLVEISLGKKGIEYRALVATEWHPIVHKIADDWVVAPADVIDKKIKVLVYEPKKEEAGSPWSQTQTDISGIDYIDKNYFFGGHPNPDTEAEAPLVYTVGVAGKSFLGKYVCDTNEQKRLENQYQSMKDTDDEFSGVSTDQIAKDILDKYSANRMEKYERTEDRVKELRELLGLDLSDHVIFTNRIASGSMFFQYIYTSFIKDGITLEMLDPPRR